MALGSYPFETLRRNRFLTSTSAGHSQWLPEVWIRYNIRHDQRNKGANGRVIDLPA